MSSIRSASSRTRTRHAVERDHAALHQVVQPAGRRDEHVRVLRLLGLCAEWDAAVDGRDPQPLRLGERTEVGCDLGRKLTRGDEDERRGASVRLRGALDERQAEGERLA